MTLYLCFGQVFIVLGYYPVDLGSSSERETILGFVFYVFGAIQKIRDTLGRGVNKV